MEKIHKILTFIILAECALSCNSELRIANPGASVAGVRFPKKRLKAPKVQPDRIKVHDEGKESLGQPKGKVIPGVSRGIDAYSFPVAPPPFEDSEVELEWITTDKESVDEVKKVLKTKMGRSKFKGGVRKFESVMKAFRGLAPGKDKTREAFSGLIKEQDLGFKHKYFLGAVQQKWTEPNLYNQMVWEEPTQLSNFETWSLRHGRGALDKLKESRIYLGMAPNVQILDGIKAERVASGRTNSFALVSVVEDFEILYIGNNIYSEAGLLRSGESTRLVEYVVKRVECGKDRHAGVIRLDPKDSERLGINNWYQFATPDRTMMNGKILERAIDRILHLWKGGYDIYIHCKSGKSRSATAWVAAQVAVAIDLARSNHVLLSVAEIDSLIAYYLGQVQKHRGAVKLRKPQITNMKRVLYLRALGGSFTAQDS